MVLSVASQKGGTGKTTTSITLSAALAYVGKRVLLVDMDSQANTSKVLLHDYASIPVDDTIHRTIIEKKPLPIHQASLIQGIDVVPSHIFLSNADVELTTAKDHREARLKIYLDQIKDQYDHVIIDCPPALGWLTLNAFTASDGVLVPVAPGYFELESITQIIRSLGEVEEFFNPRVRLIGFLFTMSDPTLNTKNSLKLLRQTYPDDVLQTIIPRNTDIRDAHMHKQDVFTYSPQSKSALSYKRLIDELGL